MSITLNKQTCHACGQSINEREIGLYRGMVTALYEVWKWASIKDIHEFTRKDIKHLLQRDNEIARFGDWVMFGGLVYKKGKGHYGLNMERCSEFFKGERRIPTVIYKNPLDKSLRPDKYRYIKEIPSLSSFLAENGEYIVRYSVKKEDTYHVNRLFDL